VTLIATRPRTPALSTRRHLGLRRPGGAKGDEQIIGGVVGGGREIFVASFWAAEH